MNQKWWTNLLFWLATYRLRIGVVLATIIIATFLAYTLTPYKQAPPDNAPFAATPERQVSYVRAEVTKIGEESSQAKILEGPQKDQTRDIVSYNDTNIRVGSTVLIPEKRPIDGPTGVASVWRMPWLLALLAIMICLVVAIGGRQGALSIGGLAVSIGVVIIYIIPATIHGANALTTSVIGAFAIATIAIAMAHTLRWRTVISLMSIYLSLVIVILLAMLSGWLAGLTGIYDETSSIVNATSGISIDMYGILLGGIIIASLGVLDDVVTTQVATVDEMHQLQKRVSRRELFRRGMSVGREHLSALINTLALAYIGVALPTVISLSLAMQSNGQFLSMINMEYMSVEIIRTAISSIGIILAIPLSTALAALLVGKQQQVMQRFKKKQPKAE